MVKLSIPNQIKKIRKDRKMTQADLSSLLNVGTTTVSVWESGVNTPPVEKLEAMSNIFDVPISYFFSETDYINYIKKVTLPVYHEVSFGSGLSLFGNTTDFQDVPKDWIDGGNHFCLRAAGDYMVGGKIHEGDLLIIREQSFIENGDIAVVIIKNKIQLKRIYRNDNIFTLVSENTKYPPQKYNPNVDIDIRIVGKIKKSITDF